MFPGEFDTKGNPVSCIRIKNGMFFILNCLEQSDTKGNPVSCIRSKNGMFFILNCLDTFCSPPCMGTPNPINVGSFCVVRMLGYPSDRVSHTVDIEAKAPLFVTKGLVLKTKTIICVPLETLSPMLDVGVHI